MVQNLWYLFAAYMVIWTALFAYIVSLGRKNRELQEELRTLQTRVERLFAQRDAS